MFIPLVKYYVEKIWWKIRSIFHLMTILTILTPFSVDYLLLTVGENWCWQLKGVEGKQNILFDWPTWSVSQSDTSCDTSTDCPSGLLIDDCPSVFDATPGRRGTSRWQFLKVLPQESKLMFCQCLCWFLVITFKECTRSTKAPTTKFLGSVHRWQVLPNFFPKIPPPYSKTFALNLQHTLMKYLIISHPKQNSKSLKLQLINSPTYKPPPRPSYRLI